MRRFDQFVNIGGINDILHPPAILPESVVNLLGETRLQILDDLGAEEIAKQIAD